MPLAPILASSSVPANPPDIRARILRQARRDFFAGGYSQFTMDGLAAELGMSKKTLYVHFAGKDEIIGAVIDHLAAEVRTDADVLLRNRELNLAEKLRGFVEGMVERLSALHPHTMRDLQRFAPPLYDRLEAVRRTTIPYVFGRFVEQGQIEGLIHDELPTAFAVEYFLHAMQGMMHPATLERLRLEPREVIGTAVDLFFGGLLTNAGRKQYEKLFPR
jgi:AcrR family transcriptional regulator